MLFVVGEVCDTENEVANIKCGYVLVTAINSLQLSKDRYIIDYAEIFQLIQTIVIYIMFMDELYCGVIFCLIVSKEK
jgi:hypothetical protein